MVFSVAMRMNLSIVLMMMMMMILRKKIVVVVVVVLRVLHAKIQHAIQDMYFYIVALYEMK
jgi:hypothetical protein